MSRKAVFIDKDGTLVRDVAYNANPDLIALNPGSDELRELSLAGYKLVVISNQPGVAFGHFRESELFRVASRLKEIMHGIGAPLSGFYYCPHHPSASEKSYRRACPCRKPSPGLLLQAAEGLDIDLKRSWMIGDILDDVEAGNRAGCSSILLDNGNETEWQQAAPERRPAFIAQNLSSAARFILENRSVAQ